MPDREKVIKGLDCCLDVIRSRQFSSGCGFCPYVSAEHCKVKMIEDAIALLKEQESVKHGRWLKGGYVCGETEWICSVCGETEWRTNCNRMKYCMFCGAKMDLKGEDDAETDLR